jgi:hypothetical protein
MTIRSFPEYARDGSFWIDLFGDIIIVRVRGEATTDILRGCQDALVRLLEDTDRNKILYDTLEMTEPTVELAYQQRRLDEQFAQRGLRRAIVVPNARLAYLSRLAFGDAEHRVFYNDLPGAIRWLERPNEIN